MTTIAAGKFKQTCLRLLDKVNESGEPIVITKRGKPVAQLVPYPPAGEWRGCLAKSGRILDDLVAPAAGVDDWTALRD